MNRILCTFPGRAGDLLWALPTVRAISEHFGVPVDLQIAHEFAPMVDLLSYQPYLAGVWPDPRWTLTPPDDWRAPELPQRYDRVFRLGYRGWPELPLPLTVYANAISYLPDNPPTLPPLDLKRPWITVPPDARCTTPFVIGFTEAWFELKLGLLHSLATQALQGIQLTPRGTRWTTEAHGLPVYECGWREAAQVIAQCGLFLGDCSALHVLAVALGKPCVIMEPMPERLNPIFWPLGKDGPQVTLVRGNDGEATFDARHTAETLERILGASHAR